VNLRISVHSGGRSVPGTLPLEGSSNSTLARLLKPHVAAGTDAVEVVAAGKRALPVEVHATEPAAAGGARGQRSRWSPTNLPHWATHEHGEAFPEAEARDFVLPLTA